MRPHCEVQRLSGAAVGTRVGADRQRVEGYRGARDEGNFWRKYHYREGDLVELTRIGIRFSFDVPYRRIPM